MKSLVICFLTMLLLYSCGPEILDNRRMLIEGTLVNAQGAPIPNQEILVKDYFENDNPGFIGRTRDLLGETVTNQDGSFSFISLVTDGDAAIVIDPLNNSGSPYVIPNERWNENEAIIIPELVRKELAVVELDFVNTSGLSTPFNVDIFFHREFCEVELSENGFQIATDCPPINEVINNGFSDTITFQPFYPSTITVVYSLNNQPVTQELIITSPNESYVINY